MCYNSVLCAIVVCFVSASGEDDFINLSKVECGISGGRQSRVVGGEMAGVGEFPWAASLWQGGAHQCGAVVLNDKWVATAGHCVCSNTGDFYRPSQLKIGAGANDISSIRQSLIPISKVIPHPDYRCIRAKNDLTLLETINSIPLSSMVVPACLPTPRSGDYAGVSANVAGWGWTHEDRLKGPRSDDLLKVSVGVLKNEVCAGWFGALGRHARVTPAQICAGHEQGGRDSCWADSGGPLSVKDGRRSLVVGVVSTGIGCGRPKLPGLYTRVSHYVVWIAKIVRPDLDLGISALDDQSVV